MYTKYIHTAVLCFVEAANVVILIRAFYANTIWFAKSPRFASKRRRASTPTRTPEFTSTIDPLHRQLLRREKRRHNVAHVPPSHTLLLSTPPGHGNAAAVPVAPLLSTRPKIIRRTTDVVRGKSRAPFTAIRAVFRVREPRSNAGIAAFPSLLCKIAFPVGGV
jgi:hypothetical protein